MGCHCGSNTRKGLRTGSGTVEAGNTLGNAAGVFTRTPRQGIEAMARWQQRRQTTKPKAGALSVGFAKLRRAKNLIRGKYLIWNAHGILNGNRARGLEEKTRPKPEGTDDGRDPVREVAPGVICMRQFRARGMSNNQIPPMQIERVGVSQDMPLRTRAVARFNVQRPGFTTYRSKRLLLNLRTFARYEDTQHINPPETDWPRHR